MLQFFDVQRGIMKKYWIRIIALILIVVLGCGILSGCELLGAIVDNEFGGNYPDTDDGFGYEDPTNPDPGDFDPGDFDPDNPNNPSDPDEPDNPDDPDDKYDEQYGFLVTCGATNTGIMLSGIGYYGDEAELVYVKPYEYLYGDKNRGISENVVTDYAVVGDYKCCTRDTFVIPRINAEGYDTVYCKFYVLDSYDKSILAGPVYATSITPELEHDEVVQATGIKGIMSDWGWSQYAVELGCQHTETNFVIGEMIVPLEYYNENTHEIIDLHYTEDYDESGRLYVTSTDVVNPYYGQRQYVEKFVHNGKTYYFRTDFWGGWPGLDFYDNEIATYTRAHIKMTLIVLWKFDYTENSQFNQPYFLTYPAARTSNRGEYFAVNTSNPIGAEYWAAFTKFLAMHYNQETTYADAEHGTVEAWIMGNEIDQAAQWNTIVDTNNHEPIEVDDYTAEYERMLRITNQSLKSVYSRCIALVPFTHFWNGNGSVYANDYNPKIIFDLLCNKTRSEGNYNWGMAIHPYGSNLANPNFWSGDIVSGVTGTFNTRRITWTNLEVLQLYLEQSFTMCDEQVRDVYVTEGGVSSSDSEKNDAQFELTKNQQAAGVAYAYYKCSQLSCIKALNYYKLVDTPIEGAYFGLMTTYPTPIPKPSFYVYKYIDTQYSWRVTAPYLQYITWSEYVGGKLVPHGSSVDPSFDWVDAMSIRPPQGFNWSERWDESKIIVRQIAEEDYQPYA